MRKGDRGKKRDAAPVDQVKRPSVFVATPAYDGKVDTDFAMSLAETAMAATAHGILFRASVMGNGAFIDLARNTFVQFFLESDCTHLLFIDSDLKWDPMAALMLVTSDKPVCAGVYRKRQEPESYPVQYLEEPGGGLTVHDNKWVKCSRVPTGFLCIRRDVVEKMAARAPRWRVDGQTDAPRLFYTKTIPSEDAGTDLFVGEDFVFCDDYAEQFGEPIWVLPNINFVHGGYACNWHQFMMSVAELEDVAA